MNRLSKRLTDEIGGYSSSSMDKGLLTLHENDNDFNNSNFASSTIMSLKDTNSMSDRDTAMNGDGKHLDNH